MFLLTYWICRTLAAVGGALFIWVAIFLKVEEEARVKRTIDNWSDRLATWPAFTRNRRQRWLIVSASIAAAALSRIFGRKFFSFRAFIASAVVTALSVTSTLIVVVISDGRLPWQLVLAFGALLVASVAPTLKLGAERLSAVIVSLLPIWLFGDFIFQRSLPPFGIVVTALMLTAGIVSNYIFIAVARWAIPRIILKPTITRVLVLMLGSIMLTAALVAAAYLAGGTIGVKVALRTTHADESDPFVMLAVPLVAQIAGAFVASANLGVVLSGASVFVIALALAIDSILWAVLERPVHAAAHLDILKRRTLLAGIGVALISAATATGGALVSRLLTILTR
jgi:hypothetical protein